MVLVAALLSLGALACAQEAASQRIVVPAREGAHPRLVNVSALNGSITVKSYGGKDVIVEISGGGRAEQPAPAGMRRIDLPRGLEVSEEDNTINVRLGPPAFGKLAISVPADTSLKLKTAVGPITVEGVRGEVEAKSVHGEVTLTGISGTVVADSLNSAIKVTMDRVDPAKPMSFSSLNGALDVTLPATTKANLKMRTDRGQVYSDFEIKMAPNGPATNRQKGLRSDRTMYGTINGGGPEISFRTLNGKINIRKK
jgi:DUF4097 and DUF4098 domain-containing protein YvlB